MFLFCFWNWSIQEFIFSEYKALGVLPFVSTRWGRRTRNRGTCLGPQLSKLLMSFQFSSVFEHWTPFFPWLKVPHGRAPSLRADSLLAVSKDAPRPHLPHGFGFCRNTSNTISRGDCSRVGSGVGHHCHCTSTLLSGGLRPGRWTRYHTISTTSSLPLDLRFDRESGCDNTSPIIVLGMRF